MTAARVVLYECDNKCESERNVTDPKLGMPDARTPFLT